MSEHSSKDHNVTIEAHEKAVTPDSSSARPPSSDGEENVEIGTKLKGAKLVILVCSLMCGIFMVALDGQIIGKHDAAVSISNLGQSSHLLDSNRDSQDHH